MPFIADSIAYRGFQADLTGLGGKLDLVPSQRFAAGPIVSFEFGRDDDASNDVIARLPAVDIAIELGGFVRYQTLVSRMKEGRASIEVQVRQLAGPGPAPPSIKQARN